MHRNIGLDVTKLILAFMVVGLHAGFLGDVSTLAEYLSVNGLFRVAVPIFFIINGFFFRSVMKGGTEALWLKRVLYLYLFWMLVYSYSWFKVEHYSVLDLANIIWVVFIGHFHLWYLPGMMGAALLLIVLRNTKETFLLLVSFCLFFIGVLIQYLGSYDVLGFGVFDELIDNKWAHRNFLLLSFPFFVWGYLIGGYDLHNKLTVRHLAIILFFGLLLLFIESFTNYFFAMDGAGFDNLLSLAIVCPVVFMLVMKLNFYGTSANLSAYASGVYFVHPIFMGVFRRVFGLDYSILALAVIIAALVSTYFLIKINKTIKIAL